MIRSELEELRIKRAQLEETTRSLKRKQKKLEENVLILEERVIIEDLENQQKQLNDKVSALEKQKEGLESKLQIESDQKPIAQKKINKKKPTPKSKRKVSSTPKVD